MKILVDMNLSPLWIPFLGQHGFEAVHWSEVGAATARDEEIMDYARTGKFVIFTHDLDFGTLLATLRIGGPSVIQIRAQDVLPTAIGHQVVSSLKETRAHLDTGALVSIDPMQYRIRLLPI
jgi:predicted nuclease of predicted toxin-antitoxin system